MTARPGHVDPVQVRRDLTIEQARLDELCLEVYGFPAVRKPRHPYRPAHPCSRCGIDTRNVGMCRDCREVTA